MRPKREPQMTGSRMYRRRFLKAAAAVPAAAIAVARAETGAPAGAVQRGGQAEAAASDVTAQARAMFDAMKARLGRTYSEDDERRVMRRLEGAVRTTSQMTAASLKNGEEPATIFDPARGQAPGVTHAPAARASLKGARP